MYRCGLVSVTYRALSHREVIDLAADAGLSCIEWGSDVHAPACDAERLADIVAYSRERGIECCSYGTYFRLGLQPLDELVPYIAAARLLGTDVLRIWAGNKNYTDMTEVERAALIDEARRAAALAAREGIVLCLEWHTQTMTNCLDGALALIESVDSPALRLYWQPSQYRPFAHNLAEARRVAPYVVNLHVFAWELASGKLIRQALSDGREAWTQYLACFDGTQHALLEFVPDDDPALLSREAATLRALIKEEPK
ncbi:MAG: TIM barrel protein [Clostridia bacterium]|nr:TIM barrel protein [Clostridia bacterium]